jgi:hypothetical protein
MYFAHAVRVNLHCQLGGCDSFSRALLHNPQVRTLTRQSFESTVAVKRRLDLRQRQTQCACDEAGYARVEVSTARAHHKTFKRGHSHRCIDRPSAIDRADAGAASNVAAHDTKF